MHRRSDVERIGLHPDFWYPVRRAVTNGWRSITGSITEKFAAYGGTPPRVHASGGKTRFGPLRSDVTHSLKWAFGEAAPVSCRHRRRHPTRHVSRLDERVARRKGHPKAIGAVARHLAEATSWMLTKQEPYPEPRLPQARPAKAGLVHGGVSARSP